ncbi:hypothetical protein [Saccharothrix hoggarensis]|uniref:Uncharacterized protein n=1 Tax=Saccharothrix hoggarensis TaxID=913853 RepID=A0ABW3QN38_9PSEU
MFTAVYGKFNAKGDFYRPLILEVWDAQAGPDLSGAWVERSEGWSMGWLAEQVAELAGVHPMLRLVNWKGEEVEATDTACYRVPARPVEPRRDGEDERAYRSRVIAATLPDDVLLRELETPHHGLDDEHAVRVYLATLLSEVERRWPVVDEATLLWTAGQPQESGVEQSRYVTAVVSLARKHLANR